MTNFDETVEDEGEVTELTHVTYFQVISNQQ